MLTYFSSEMTYVGLERDETGGSYTDGEYTEATRARQDIQIVVPQPIRENDLNMLEDGEKPSDYLVSWAFKDIGIRTREGDKDADWIRYLGKVYKVVQVNNRDELGNFRRFVMRDISGGP